MVVTQLYCAEQILIPEVLSNVLKTFAKAAVKTQPYDLLRWSAAYFRCLSMSVPPPVKMRYEKNPSYGSITRGYLRVLIEQIGMGYFVKKELIENRWQGLCLPEDELLQFLSLARMFNWEQIHWLKVLSIMVGSLNDSFQCTITMLCELLTTEPEGSPSPIPLWMFKECYKFLAELDCSREQTFINGRKILVSGALEDEHVMIQLPKVLSTTSFRNIILDELKKKVGRTTQIRYKRDLAASDISSLSEKDDDDIIERYCPRKDDSDSDDSNISASFQLIGNVFNPFDVCKRSPDFDSVIVVLKSIRDNENLRHYNGPFHISDQDYKKQQRRQVEVETRREQMSQTMEENANKCIEDKNLELLKEIGPPWSWLNQFASQNCCSRSFNFIEDVSICSDETPCRSCDGSFDFDIEDFRKPKMITETVVSSSEESCRIPEVEMKEESLIEEEQLSMVLDVMVSEVPSSASVHEVVQSVIDELMVKIEEAIKLGECDLTDNCSLMKIIDGSKPPAKKCINYKQLRTFLEQAESAGMKFSDLNQLYQFFSSHSGKFADKLVYDVYDPTLTKNVSDIAEDAANLECVKEMEASPSIDFSNDFKPKDNDIVEIFAECGLELDQKVLDTPTQENMILGLIDADCEVPPIEEESIVSIVEEQEEEVDETLFRNENTQTLPYAKISQELKRCGAKPQTQELPSETSSEPYMCKIPPMNGIGSRVSKATIDCFLGYLKQRAITQKGMIYPRNFVEKLCPNMID